IGFQQLMVPDPDGEPLPVAIWYPSNTTPSLRPLGTFSQSVAIDGEVSGRRLPLIVMSHGSGGSAASHYDTAAAFAGAGVVVAAVTHTGDNSVDQRYAGNRKDLIDRPRQLKLVTDYVLSVWSGHANIDAARLGAFGFSLGAFTALVGSIAQPSIASSIDRSSV